MHILKSLGQKLGVGWGGTQYVNVAQTVTSFPFIHQVTWSNLKGVGSTALPFTWGTVSGVF